MSEPDPALVRRADVFLIAATTIMDGHEPTCASVQAFIDDLRSLPAAACSQDKRIAELEAEKSTLADLVEDVMWPTDEEWDRAEWVARRTRVLEALNDEEAREKILPAEEPAPQFTNSADGRHIDPDAVATLDAYLAGHPEMRDAMVPAEAPAPTCATCKGGGRVRYASRDPIFGRTPGPEFPCPDCATGGDDAE